MMEITLDDSLVLDRIRPAFSEQNAIGGQRVVPAAGIEPATP